MLARALPQVELDSWYVVPEKGIYIDLREGSLTAATIRVESSDLNRTWLLIDRYSGQIISVIDSSRHFHRWLHNDLHSVDFSGIADRRPLWDAVMLVLLMGGLVVSITGVVIGMRRLESLLIGS